MVLVDVPSPDVPPGAAGVGGAYPADPTLSSVGLAFDTPFLIAATALVAGEPLFTATPAISGTFSA